MDVGIEHLTVLIRIEIGHFYISLTTSASDPAWASVRINFFLVGTDRAGANGSVEFTGPSNKRQLINRALCQFRLL